METQTLIIILLVAYNVWMLTYILLERHVRERKPHKEDKQPISPPTQGSDIIGKSKFKIGKSVPLAAKSTPSDATEQKDDSIPEMPVTFASDKETEPSARVADEDMDDAFSDVRMDSLPKEFGDDDDYDGTPNEGYATGGTFEEIAESVETVKNPNATAEQKLNAGKVFAELEGTTLFEKIISDYPERKNRIANLMDNLYKTANEREKPNIVKKEFKPPTSLEEFNIRDYV